MSETTMNSPKLKLTPDEVELIEHRLDVPDAIAEAIEEDESDVIHACEVLRERLFDARRGTPLDSRLIHGLETKVLIDAVEGSTYYGCIPDELPHEQRRVRRVGNNLASRLSRWLGRRVTFPTC